MKVYSNEKILCNKCGKMLTFMVKDSVSTIRCGHRCVVYYPNEPPKVSVWKVVGNEEHKQRKEGGADAAGR